MVSEAQRLIGISLSKIAQSRTHRGGVSLHKNLLVATVLQKARYILMEEAYSMVHYQPPAPVQPRPVPDDELVALTAEEAGVEAASAPPADDALQELLQPTTCGRCADKENQPPATASTSAAAPTDLIYLDLDKAPNVLRERGNACLKRRRAVAEWETEEAVQSILPKRSRHEDDTASTSTAPAANNDDSVFLDEATCLTDAVPNTNGGSAMEIDRITSLVSIFSFSMGGETGGGGGGGGGNNNNKLNRSMSTPDLCAAQAKDVGDAGIQQRPFLAMTV